MDDLVIDYLRCRQGRIGRRHGVFAVSRRRYHRCTRRRLELFYFLQPEGSRHLLCDSLLSRKQVGRWQLESDFFLLRRIGCRAARIQVCQMYSSRSLAVLFPSSLSDISASGGRWLKKPSRQRKAAVDVLSVVYLSVTQPHWKLKSKD